MTTNEIEKLTWQELLMLLYETQETHDSRLRKRLQDEVNRRHKYI